MSPAVPEPRTFVLLHGGRHGGWCWRPTADLLRAGGHQVLTPTLTGLGERAHLLGPGIGLDTHVQDLVAVFEFEDLRDVVLVCHSYGGTVAANAMERIADRVRSLVLLDAHLPLEGECVLDVIGPERAAHLLALAEREGEGWYVPPESAARYGVTDPVTAAWVDARLTAQPLRTYRDPCGPTDRAWRHPGMFIECTPSSLTPAQRERARARSAADPAIVHRVLATPHNAMVTAPADLATLLIQAGTAE
jgi:pimeloyl-ACP methyl ester carboxylesterase